MPKPTQLQQPDASPFDVLASRRRQSSAHPDIQTVEQPTAQTSDSHGHTDVQTGGQPSGGGGKFGRGGKRSDPDFLKFTVYIPKTTHRTAKAIANLQGRELSDVVEDLLKGYIRDQQDDALRNL